MIDIELDGKKVSVPEGSMVMHAAEAAGAYVPHFCYHKKLSIAANCRMCLVDIEKAPKPMPACATPVTAGMVVKTQSDKAVKAQKSVMEFLLINHPLDCPICDQGGECQLQDLAVGYGGSQSRYTEEKRVVFHKNVGPLISMEEMSRCIHCTRCVRFGQEVAGVMELGMLHRGEHSEITTFVGRTVDSELSGNMIDLCPVGALTSKPFRYSARTWELARRRSVSPHDSTGANLIVQVKGDKVLRVVPSENEEVNECWIADRDRFSYEALNSEARLTTPMVRQDGKWVSTDWNTALEYVARSLKKIVSTHGPSALGALASAHSTLEEMHLLARVVRGMGSESIDHRLRHTDFRRSGDAATSPRKARWLGRSVASLSQLDTAWVIGSFLRKDHPLFAQRLRQAARRGAKVMSLHALRDDWLMPVAQHWVTAPSQWVSTLASVAGAVAQAKGVTAPLAVAVTEEAKVVASALMSGQQKAIFLGNAAAHHPQAEELLAIAGWIASQVEATVGVLGEAANSVGAQWAGALPGEGGLNAGQMVAQPPRAMILLNVETLLDVADSAKAQTSFEGCDLVVAFTAFKDAHIPGADVLLPVAPFTETSGTFVNAEGRAQSFQGVVKPLGQARPAWKVLRVLGNLLELPGFDYTSSEAVAQEVWKGLPQDLSAQLSNAASLPASVSGSAGRGEPASIERIAHVPIYATDALVRRAPALQATADARPAEAHVGEDLWASLGLRSGDRVRVEQGHGAAELPAVMDPSLAKGTIRVAAGVIATAPLGRCDEPIRITRVAAAQGAAA